MKRTINPYSIWYFFQDSDEGYIVLTCHRCCLIFAIFHTVYPIYPFFSLSNHKSSRNILNKLFSRSFPCRIIIISLSCHHTIFSHSSAICNTMNNEDTSKMINLLYTDRIFISIFVARSYMCVCSVICIECTYIIYHYFIV